MNVHLVLKKPASGGDTLAEAAEDLQAQAAFWAALLSTATRARQITIAAYISATV